MVASYTVERAYGVLWRWRTAYENLPAEAGLSLTRNGARSAARSRIRASRDRPHKSTDTALQMAAE
jgi:hypothetical protein